MLAKNYHTHTKRCGHAVGEDEDYVLTAIRGGVKTLGFSDHAPYIQPCPTDRMNIEQAEEYFRSVRTLAERYKDRIDIKLGLEVECYKDQWETLAKWRELTDYCILGQHELSFAGTSIYSLSTPEELSIYGDLLEYACEHALCDCIAHPDVCLYRYPSQDESVKALARRIADISVKYDMPLELNCGSGVHHDPYPFTDGTRYAYPNRIFFEEFAKKNCRILVGLDIHNPDDFLTDLYINRAMAIVEGLGCNIRDDIDLVEEAKARKKLFY